jgi:hypothetical protein
MKEGLHEFLVLSTLHGDLATGHVWVSVDGWKPRTVGKIIRYKDGVPTGKIYAECLTIDYGFRKDFINLMESRHEDRKKIARTRVLFSTRDVKLISMSRWHRNLLGIHEAEFHDWTREPALPGVVGREDFRVTKLGFTESLWARLWIGFRHPLVATRVSMALGSTSVGLGLYSLWSSVPAGVCLGIVAAGALGLNAWFYFHEDRHG